ncbi:MAG: hypothetical protein JST54_05120 [Deltaproteobacteria bacterium]|nr:hypothetical protein [Deltaproteobacteria bacterium]
MDRTNRRNRRSDAPVQALTLLLDACRARGGYAAMIVADELGFLVGASSNDDVDARALAANLLHARRHATHGKVTHVPFRFMDRTLYVGALGEGSAAPLVDAVYGARRILAA